MLEQLRYSGVFEAVTIRKSGYPFRLKLDTFVAWYKCLLLDTSEEGLRHFRIEPFREPALQSRAAQILEATGQDFSGVRYGHTMVRCRSALCRSTALCRSAALPLYRSTLCRSAALPLCRSKEQRTSPQPYTPIPPTPTPNQVLYRAKEHRTLELLRNLTLEQVVPYMQRITRGALAREFRRRALRSKALLRRAITDAAVVGDLDAALVAHTDNMRAMLCIFSVPFPELAEVKTLRAAMQLWLDLEVELTRLLAEHAKGAGEADAVADAIEVYIYICICVYAYV